MKTQRPIVFAILILTAVVWLEAQQVPASAVPTGEQIVSYLNQTLDWHRQIATEEQLTSEAADTLFVADSKQLDTQIVRLSFDFARAAAAVAQTVPAASLADGGQSGRYQSLAKSAAAAESEVKQTQAEMESIQRKLESAPAKQRADLRAQLDELGSELALAQTRSQTLREMTQFVSGASAGGGNLAAQIDELQRTVPETMPVATQNASASAQSQAQTTATAAAGAAAAQANRRPKPQGILNLVTDLFSLHRKYRALDQAIAATDDLEQASKQIRSPVVSALQANTQRGEQLASAADSADASQLEEYRHQLDALTAQFKQLSAIVLPVGKQSILLNTYRANLVRWRDTVRSDYDLELKETAIRVVVFGTLIFVVLALAEVWKRAIFRYVHDNRRRYQFLLLRRIMLWCVIGITIAFALASEIGSIATFAGLITAGIAVALQNVILAIAGYFFLIGKYGVRVGDRVQISGVTGDVVDIGLIRLHLMEIGGTGSDRHPTGRVVVFSNSVVFQATASFYKQIPGTNFVWHEVSLTLAPDSEYAMAERRIVGAVERVFAKYQERIEKQHRAMESTLNMSVPAAKPHSRLQLTQGGLEVVIRYPVELDTATDIDDKITRELLQALNEPPKLKLVGTGTPNIQMVSPEDGGAPPGRAA